MHAHELIVDACVHGVDEVYAPAIYLGTSGAFAAATKCASSGPTADLGAPPGLLRARSRDARDAVGGGEGARARRVVQGGWALLLLRFRCFNLGIFPIWSPRGGRPLSWLAPRRKCSRTTSRPSRR
jgi:hypothetical protein